MKSSLPEEKLKKLIGHAVKVGPGKTANGHYKDGPMICKLIDVQGKKAIILPKKHRRSEVVDADRIMIWKKGLHLGNMSEEEISSLMGNDTTNKLNQLTPSLQSMVNESELRRTLEIKDKQVKPSAKNYEFISLKEACRLIKDDEDQVYALINTGTIRHRGSGKNLRVNKKDLLEWLKTKQDYDSSVFTRRRKSAPQTIKFEGKTYYALVVAHKYVDKSYATVKGWIDNSDFEIYDLADPQDANSGTFKYITLECFKWIQKRAKDKPRQTAPSSIYQNGETYHHLSKVAAKLGKSLPTIEKLIVNSKHAIHKLPDPNSNSNKEYKFIDEKCLSYLNNIFIERKRNNIKNSRFVPSDNEYSVDQVCKIIKRSKQAIYNLKNKGELTGRRGVIDKDSVDKYLKSHDTSYDDELVEATANEDENAKVIEKPIKTKSGKQKEVALDQIEMFDQMEELFKQRNDLKERYDILKAELEEVTLLIEQNNKDIIAASKLVSE